MTNSPRVVLSLALLTSLVVGGCFAVGSAWSGPFALGPAVLMAYFVFLLIWPWALLPLTIIGGIVGPAIVGRTDFASVAGAQTALLVIGVLAVGARWLVGLEQDDALRRLWAWALPSTLVVALGASWGAANGNNPSDVLLGVYLVGVIPIYFLATIFTLGTEQRRRQAMVLFTVVVVVLTAISFAAPGQHGGLFSLFPLPYLIVQIGRERGWRRSALVVAGSLLAADVVLASYRGVWIAGAVAMVVLALRGSSYARRGTAVLAATLAACVALAVTVSVSVGGLLSRVNEVSDALGRGGGYRGEESAVGLSVFADQPLWGHGLGQSVAGAYIRDFGVTDVGPQYHSFFVLLLANVGLIGLLLVVTPLIWTAATALRHGDDLAVASAGLTLGFLSAAAIASPTAGHWELGALGAVTLLTLHSSVDHMIVVQRRLRQRTSA